MVFEPEPAIEAVEDGLNPLSDLTEVTESGLFVLSIRADQVGAEALDDEAFEFSAREALVSEDGLSLVDQAVITFQERLGDLAFSDSRIGRPQMMGMPSGLLTK